jgi:putative endonuclease
MSGGAYLYILLCADESYYTGTTRADLEYRVAQHNAGTYGGYTATRRPVTLVFAQWFDRITDAIEAERQVKGWSRAKKEALIRGEFDEGGMDAVPVQNLQGGESAPVVWRQGASTSPDTL